MSTTSAARRRVRSRLPALAALASILFSCTAPASANNYGESASWQFATPNDLATQTALRDLIERRRGGVFAAPIYNTRVDRQYNCSIAATATGNSGDQSAAANSPGVTGATSSATGNSNAATVAGDTSIPNISSEQLNGGPVTSTLVGATTTTVSGSPTQVLNSNQANSGNQSASVTGANACAFGALN